MLHLSRSPSGRLSLEVPVTPGNGVANSAYSLSNLAVNNLMRATLSTSLASSAMLSKSQLAETSRKVGAGSAQPMVRTWSQIRPTSQVWKVSSNHSCMESVPRVHALTAVQHHYRRATHFHSADPLLRTAANDAKHSCRERNAPLTAIIAPAGLGYLFQLLSGCCQRLPCGCQRCYP